MSQPFVISLKSAFLLENGEKLLPKGSTLLSVALVYPREKVDLIERLKTLPIDPEEHEKNRPLEVKKEYSFANVPYEDKLLFKESIQGDSIIKVTLSVAASPNKVDEFLKKLAKTAAITAIGTLSGGIGVTITAAVGGTIIESLFSESKKDEKVVINLGSARFGINNATQDGDMVFHLVTNKEIKYTLERKEEEDQITEIVRTIPKGYGIAKIVLNVAKVPKEEDVPVIA